MNRDTETIRGYIPDPAINFLMILRSSLLISMTVLGLLFIAIAFLAVDGVVAPMFATWGASLILVGVVGYVLLWINRYR